MYLPSEMGLGFTVLTMTQTVSHPLKEGHHFDQQLGGVAGLFESIRSNTTVSAKLTIPVKEPG
jgi:hypothetical protein